MNSTKGGKRMSNKIRDIIETKGLKASFVIKSTGLSKAGFYAIVNGESIPSLKTARKICKVLDKTIDEVFPDDILEDG